MCLSKTIRGEGFPPYLVLQPAFDFKALPERFKKKSTYPLILQTGNQTPRKVSAFERYKKEKKNHWNHPNA